MLIGPTEIGPVPSEIGGVPSADDNALEMVAKMSAFFVASGKSSAMR